MTTTNKEIIGNAKKAITLLVKALIVASRENAKLARQAGKAGGRPAKAAATKATGKPVRAAKAPRAAKGDAAPAGKKKVPARGKAAAAEKPARAPKAAK